MDWKQIVVPSLTQLERLGFVSQSRFMLWGWSKQEYTEKHKDNKG